MINGYTKIYQSISKLNGTLLSVTDIQLLTGNMNETISDILTNKNYDYNNTLLSGAISA